MRFADNINCIGNPLHPFQESGSSSKHCRTAAHQSTSLTIAPTGTHSGSDTLSLPFMAGCAQKTSTAAMRSEEKVGFTRIINYIIHPWQDTSGRHHEEWFAWQGEPVRHCVIIAGEIVELSFPRRSQESYCIAAPRRRCR